MPQFDGPIPGQSLTSEPKNNPWERPPETADPDEAIVHHLTRLGKPELLDSILQGVDAGVPVSMITEMMLTGAVAKGIHSIDISLMIAPVIQDYIVNLLEEENVEFKEFFEKDESGTGKKLAISKAISGIKEKPEVKSKDKMPEDEPMEEEAVEEEMPEEMPKRGLMARGEV